MQLVSPAACLPVWVPAYLAWLAAAAVQFSSSLYLSLTRGGGGGDGAKPGRSMHSEQTFCATIFLLALLSITYFAWLRLLRQLRLPNLSDDYAALVLSSRNYELP
jgi:hypothetical protein